MHNQKAFRFVRTLADGYGVSIRCLLTGAFSRSSKDGGKLFRCAVRSAEHEASKWIARLNADEVSIDDSERFEVWRALHLRHARAYEELFSTWRSLIAAKSVDGM